MFFMCFVVSFLSFSLFLVYEEGVLTRANAHFECYCKEF